MRKSLALAFSVLATTASAGWNSGGGMIVKDGNNPWFLQNTSTIKACIIIDRDYFHMKSADPDVLKGFVQQAWSYWQAEFKQAFVPGGNYVQVATQPLLITDYIELHSSSEPNVHCSDDTDIALQFGYLTTEQNDYFQRAGADIVSVTVRTDYDRLHLRGKGFIYFRPDDGPHSQSSPGTIANPWALGQGYLLMHALRHEFGHVCGVQHMGIGSIMAVDYPEMLISDEFFSSHMSNSPYDYPFFAIQAGTLRFECYSPSLQSARPMWAKFLDINPTDRCMSVELAGNEVVIRSGFTRTSMAELGRMQLTSQAAFKWQEAVHLYLPAGQAVIYNVPPAAGHVPFLIGPMMKINEFSGNYVSHKTGQQHAMTITASPLSLAYNGVLFAGDYQGHWVPDLDFNLYIP